MPPFLSKYKIDNPPSKFRYKVNAPSQNPYYPFNDILWIPSNTAGRKVGLKALYMCDGIIIVFTQPQVFSLELELGNSWLDSQKGVLVLESKLLAWKCSILETILPKC